MKILELKGYNSLRVLQVFSSLMLGLKMLPQYMKETYEDFLIRINAMPVDDQEKMIREAIHFVEIEDTELDAVFSFATDANGVRYSSENIKNLGPHEIKEIIVLVCMEVAKLKIDIINKDEKKK